MGRQRGRQTAFPLVHSTPSRTRVALEVHIKNHQMNRVCAYTSVGSLKWREVNSYRSFHIDIGRIHLLQSETIQDLLPYLFARTLAKRSYLALLFLLAWMLTRPSVEYAKDWLDTFLRLSWSSLVKYLLVWKGMFLLCSVLPAPYGVVCLQKGVWYGFDQMDAVINHFRVHEAILAWWQTNKRQLGSEKTVFCKMFYCYATEWVTSQSEEDTVTSKSPADICFESCSIHCHPH